MKIEDIREVTTEQKLYIESLSIIDIDNLIPIAIRYSEDDKNPLSISHPIIKAAIEAPLIDNSFSFQTISARLDEVVGKGYWSVNFAMLQDNIICDLTILDNTKSNIAPTSDSAFTATAMLFGIGRGDCGKSTITKFDVPDTKEVTQEIEQEEKPRRGRKPKVVEPEAIEEIEDTQDTDSIISNASDGDEDPFGKAAKSEVEPTVEESIPEEKKEVVEEPKDIVKEVEEHLAATPPKKASESSNICIHCKKIIPSATLEELRKNDKPLLHPKCEGRYTG